MWKEKLVLGAIFVVFILPSIFWAFIFFIGQVLGIETLFKMEIV